MEARIIKCTQFDEIETTSFDGVENGYEEIAIVEIDEPTQDAIVDKIDEDEEEEKQFVGLIEIPE